jgi:hypothetical protein
MIGALAMSLATSATPKQWSDAFEAGGFSDAETARYISHLKQKTAEGLALGEY